MQTDYKLKQDEGTPGMIADSGEFFAESCVGQGSGLAFGLVVVQGDSSSAVKVPDNAANKVRGVILSSHEHSADEDLVGQGLNIARKGRVWVRVENAVTVGAAGHVRYAGVGNVGQLRSAAVVDETLPVAGSFRKDAAAGELSIFEFDL